MTNAEIEAFLAVCREKTFTAAAARMFISQSSLSTRLKTLEDELGCRLFIRRKGMNTVTLTPPGEAFYPLAVQYQELIERMRNISSAGRKLRIATTNSLGTYLFPEIYDRFLSSHRGTELEVYSAELTEDLCEGLEQGTLDLAFTSGTGSGRRIRTIPVFSEDMVLVTSADTPCPEPADEGSLDPGNEVYISWSRSFDEWRSGRADAARTPGVRISIMEQLRFFLEKPGRWAIVPESAAIGLTRDSARIIRREASFRIPPRITNCLLSKKSADIPETAEFLSFLKEYLSAAYAPEHVLL